MQNTEVEAAPFERPSIRTFAKHIGVHILWILLFFVINGGFNFPIQSWLLQFHQWDARWYASIAIDGHGFLPQTYVFPPLYGWLLGALARLLTAITNIWRSSDLPVDSLIPLSAAAIGCLGFTVGNWFFVRLFCRRFEVSKAELTAIALANPMGYFAFSAYSDHLFYGLTMAIVWCALTLSDRGDLWGLNPPSRWTSPLLALQLFAAPWLRLTGFAFIAIGIFKRKEALAGILSLLGFLIYNDMQTDRPLFFLSVQSVFGMPSGNAIDGCRFAMAVFYDGISQFNSMRRAANSGDGPLFGEFLLHWINFGVVPLASLGLAAFTSIWLVKRREFLLAVLIVSVVLISHNQAVWRSTARYLMIVYPVALAIAPVDTRAYRVALVMLSFGLQIFYSHIFRSGGWAF